MTLLNPNWHQEIEQFEGKDDLISWTNNLTLYALCKRVRWTSTLEIGIGQTPNGVYLLGHLSKELGARHTAIDPANYPIRRSQMVIEHYDLPVDLIQEESQKVVWNRRLQLIYIDGNHTTEAVLGDIDNFAKWVTRNGLIIFDDYGKKHLGVTEAVDQAYEEYKDRFEMLRLPAQCWVLWRRR